MSSLKCFFCPSFKNNLSPSTECQSIIFKSEGSKEISFCNFLPEKKKVEGSYKKKKKEEKKCENYRLLGGLRDCSRLKDRERSLLFLPLSLEKERERERLDCERFGLLMFYICQESFGVKILP